MVPPSLVVMLHRWNPVATSWSVVGSGNRSPAICSMTNWSKRSFRLKAPITQSRYGHISR